MNTNSLAINRFRSEVESHAGLIETGLHPANGAPDRLKRLESSIPMRRPGTASEVAEGVLWLLSPAASYVTGLILEIGGVGQVHGHR